jgi:hypothetical protein
MQLHEVEANVAGLDVSQGFELIYDLLRAYGVPAGSIARLRNGSYNKSAKDDEVLWRDKVYYRYVTNGEDIHAAIDAARGDDSIMKLRPRFLVVCNRDQIVAIDTRTSDTLDTRLVDLPGYSAFFLPWSGIEKTQLETVNYADLKAAGQMAKLYDEIVKHNQIETEEDVHNLNVFFTRLLFCFFAEDTGVFPDGIFTNGIASHTAADGSDTARYLDGLFDVLDTAVDKRQRVPAHFADFGYVNGRLFSARASAPTFSRTARQLVIDCGSLNWSVINPDIFGSMMQAVVQAGQRESLGMHYTSVENIMKVIRPLFLDDLSAAFDAADSKVKLTRLHQRISTIKCFDPACGSGNFLVIAYKELRKLEHRILMRLRDVDPATPAALFHDSQIKLENFYGIEIDDFAQEVAILSLWLAKHQMNVEFKELFGHDIQLIPLRDTGNIVCGNAARVEWDVVCPNTPGEELYVFGNPPYLGSSLQNAQQKEDFVRFFGTTRYPKNLDYISLWFLRGAAYIARGTGQLGFVSTNSVCQGDHVGLMWPTVLKENVKISFAHESFRWTNQAKRNAGVTCVVIGLSAQPPNPRRLYRNGQVRRVGHITPYLIPGDHDIVVVRRNTPLADIPEMVRGSQPTDGGHLNFTVAERDAMLAQDPGLAPYIRRYMGADDLLNGLTRFCFWVTDANALDALTHDEIRRRVDQVRQMREQGSAPARAMATRGYRFLQRTHKDGTSIIIPRHSSESRAYIPIGLLDERTIISDAANAVYSAESWLFALLTSRIHNVWVRAVSGALETRIRYSATLCYNTFPVPSLSDTSRELLTERAFAVLEARENHSDKTLAQLYDPEKMPVELREAHQFLDAAVDQLYRRRPFQSNDERLELLFDMYQAAVGGKAQTLQDVETIADAELG